MAEEIRYRIVSDADSRGFREAAADLDKTSKAARGLRGETDKLGESFDRAEDDTFDLSDALDDARRRHVELRAEFARTGDSMALGQLRAQRSYLAQLEKVRAEIDVDRLARATPDLLGTGAAGTRVTSSVISTPFEASPPHARAAIIAVLAGAAAAAAPTIGAMLAGALAGAAGTGAMAAGILSASQDERVRSAASQFGDAISAEFFRGGAAFVAPVIRSMDILEDAFRDMEVPEALAVMAPLVTTIAGGFADFGRNIMPGLNKALGQMEPFARVAADGIGDLGASFGKFLDDVTASKGAVMGLQSLFALLDGTVRVLGFSLRFLSEMYEDWVTVQARAGRFIQGVGIALGPLGDGFQKIGGHVAVANEKMLAAASGGAAMGGAMVEAASVMATEYTPAADLAADATGSLAYAMTGAHGAFLDFMGARIGAEAALDRITEGIRRHGRTLDIDTEAGRDNLTNLQRFATEAQRAAEANFAHTGSVEQASAVYEGYKARLVETLIATGRTRKEAEKLAEVWLGVAALPNLTKNVTIAVGYTQLSQPPRALRGGDFQAFGGKLLAGNERAFQGGGDTPRGMFRVHADETVWSDRSHFVATKAQTDALYRRSPAPAGKVAVTLAVAPGGQGDFERFMTHWLYDYVRVAGAGSVQTAFGHDR